MSTSLAIETPPQPVGFEREGEVFASSRDVAAFFGKNHRDVTRAIDNLIEQEPALVRDPLQDAAPGNAGVSDRLPIFAQTVHERENPSGGAPIPSRAFDMTRDGFTLLAMGFTGAKALKWKLRYIAAFNALEHDLRNRSSAIDLSDPAQLRALLLSYNEKNEQLQEKVQALLPAQEKLDRIAQADGSFCITNAAKLLQMRPKDLFLWLQENGWIYKRPGSASFLGYHSKTATSLLEHRITTVLRADGSEKVTEQVRVTAKGLTRLAALVKPPLQ